ncbi:hypothetical protein ACFV9C_44335 [Kribbella sp. NPDC059898]|uniref:hypothetical protein n=1 Tax=Kribbella sp. NPDC059898 TaxID=3346995 RepID=UPI0036545C57
MVKKARTRPTATQPAVAPARRTRSSSWITAKAGTRATQTAVQPVVVQAPAPGSAAWLATPGTYTTSRRKKAGRRGEVVQAMPPQLPQLGAAATAVPGLVPHPGTELVPVAAPKRPGEDARAAAVAVGNWTWHYRWQLAPLAASAVTAAGAATTPVLTLLGLAAVAAAGYVSADKGPDEIGGRRWLSRAERRLLGRWAVGAGVWSAGVWIANAAGLDWSGGSLAVAAAALGLATGEQVVGWLKSRRIRRTESEAPAELSAKAIQLRDAWAHAVLTGPAGLAGSVIVDLEEPEAGTYIAIVQLRADVHAATVVTDEVRHWLERALHMGVDTARVETVREDAGRIRLVLTPERKLERVEKIWPGPVLHDGGRAPVAVGLDGKEVCLRIYNSTGVYHFLLIGSSGSGKSNALNIMLLPTVINRLSVMVYLDGKLGTSSPRLARAMDTVIRKIELFGPAIEMVYRIMISRQERYGDLGEDDFVVSADSDPIIELVLDECNVIKDYLSARHENMLGKIALTGRALGISLKYAGQRGAEVDLPGGMQVRDQMMGTVGNVIGLRPGGTNTQTTTLQSTSEEIDLMALPGGENAGGWCAILLAGKPIGYPARLMFDPKAKSRVDEVLDGFVPRELEGEDRKAAGEFYENRPTGAAWYATQQAKRKARDAQKAGGSGTVAAEVVESAPTQAAGPADAPQESDLVGDLDAITMRLHETLDDLEAGGRVVEIGKRQAAKGSRNRQAVLDGLKSAGPEGTTAAELAAAVELGLSTVNSHISGLVSDGQATREGTLIRARFEDEVTA